MKNDFSTDWAGSYWQDRTTNNRFSIYSDTESDKSATRSKKTALKVIIPVNTLYRPSLDYRSFRLNWRTVQIDLFRLERVTKSVEKGSSDVISVEVSDVWASRSNIDH